VQRNSSSISVARWLATAVRKDRFTAELYFGKESILDKKMPIQSVLSTVLFGQDNNQMPANRKGGITPPFEKDYLSR
jgi:hypothetical protein